MARIGWRRNARRLASKINAASDIRGGITIIQGKA